MTDNSPHNPSPLANILAALIILIHLGVVLSALDLYDLSRDEARYWEVSGRTLRGMIEWSAADNYPPLLFLLMAAWRPIFGESEAGLRFPFAIFSALALFVFWRILRRKPWLPAKDAVWVLALVALSPMQIFIATLAKYYTLLELLGLLFWFGMEQLMERGNGNNGNFGRDGIDGNRINEKSGDVEIDDGASNESGETETGFMADSSERGIGVSPVPNGQSGLSSRDRRDAYPPLKETDEEHGNIEGCRIAEDKQRSRLLTAVVLVALAMIYLHYLGFVIVASFILAAVLVYGWASIWNIIRQFKLRALIFLAYLPWFAIFLYRTWANLGETTELAAEQGGGALQRLGGLLATPYGLFWGNSLEPWHFGLVALSILLILGAFTFFLIHLFRTHTLNRTHTRLYPNPNLNPNLLSHPSFRFLWLFLIFSFVFTFLIITFFMRIPILFYAERFTFILPFFLAAILLSWPRRWRRPVFALTLCLFLFANYNFLAKRECLNWSYNIPWREMNSYLANYVKKYPFKIKPSNPVDVSVTKDYYDYRFYAIELDDESFGALGEYYFKKNGFEEHYLMFNDSYAETFRWDFRDNDFRAIEMIILLKYSKNNNYSSANNEWMNYYMLSEERGWVKDSFNLESLKKSIIKPADELHEFKIFTQIFTPNEKFWTYEPPEPERKIRPRDPRLMF